MLFTSYEFLAFLGILLVLYYAVPRKWQWGLLLIASYVFYAFGGVRYLAFVLLTTVSAYAASRLMGRVTEKEQAFLSGAGADLPKEERKAFRARQKRKRLHVLTLGLVLNFGVLAVLKYTGFAVYNVNELLHNFGAERTLNVPDLLLPMGISFYTFQTCGYLIDVYRAKATVQRNPFKLALFVSFFPQVIQGPISRYEALSKTLFAEHRLEAKALHNGLWRILWGYFKKLVIADRILVAVRFLADNTAEYTGVYVVLMILFYSVQIYADFTGGIDITIGIAEALGIRVAENFVRPFSSKSTKEYWNRWHITMGTWFTDYIFYPLSVSRPMLSLSKSSRKLLGKAVGKRIPVYTATVATWFLTGLWHGAGWNFIVWGLLNCVVILISQECEPLYRRFRERAPRLTSSVPYGKFMAVRTFLLMGLIRSLDVYRDVPLTFRMWGSMVTQFNLPVLFSGGLTPLGLSAVDYVILAVGVAVMSIVSRLGVKRSVRDRLYDRPVLSAALFGTLLVCVLLFGAYGVGYDATQFIYNQF